MNIVNYYVVLERKEDKYKIVFPDFQQMIIESNDVELFGLEKQILLQLSNCIWQQYQVCQQNNQPMKSPLSKDEINKSLNNGQMIFSVAIDLDKVIYENTNKLVKKTLVVPAWLNQQADACGINFSETLQNALKYKLNIPIGSIYPIMDEETASRLIDKIISQTVDGKLSWKDEFSKKDIFILQRQIEIQRESRIVVRTKLNDDSIFILADSLTQMERVGYVITKFEVYQVRSNRFEELTRLIIKSVSSVYSAVDDFLNSEK